MIAALMLVTLTGWSYWLMRRAVRGPQVNPALEAAPSVPHPAAAAGLEDDPVHWPPTRGAWTALDERQLIRLLTDPAS